MKEQNARRMFFKYLASGAAVAGATSGLGKRINLPTLAVRIFLTKFVIYLRVHMLIITVLLTKK